MPLKSPAIDWLKYLEGIIESTEIDQTIAEFESMNGRDLYNMRSVSMAAGYLIDRPVEYALHGTVQNYSLDDIKLMTDCLVDGQSFLKVGDYEHLHIEENVKAADFDAYTDDLVMVLISYYTEDKEFHTERYVRDTLYMDPLTNEIISVPCVHTVYKEQKVFNEEKLEIMFQFPLPFFPFVAFRWKQGISFLEKPHDAIIRLEAITRIISTENTERRGMALYLEGARNADQIKRAPRKFGRNIFTLPEGVNFKSPPGDPSAIELIIKEVNDLWNNLEKATGVVSTEKLASLSGISRLIAERPLIILCEDIRNIYEKGLRKVEEICVPIGGPALEISYKPLQIIEDKPSYLEMLRSAKGEGIMTGDEYKTEYRKLLELNE